MVERQLKVRFLENWRPYHKGQAVMLQVEEAEALVYSGHAELVVKKKSGSKKLWPEEI